jgi:hypothetical protein
MNSILEFVASGQIIDDIGLIDIGVAVVSARLSVNSNVDNFIHDLRSSIDIESEWGLYTAVWLTSKYGSEDELFQLIDQGEKIWVTNAHLSRTVASVYPRFIDNSHELAMVGMMEKSNVWARQAFQFQLALHKTVEGVTAIKKFLIAKNKSLPNQISHPKFLMLTVY